MREHQHTRPIVPTIQGTYDTYPCRWFSYMVTSWQSTTDVIWPCRELRRAVADQWVEPVSQVAGPGLVLQALACFCGCYVPYCSLSHLVQLYCGCNRLACYRGNISGVNLHGVAMLWMKACIMSCQWIQDFELLWFKRISWVNKCMKRLYAWQTCTVYMKAKLSLEWRSRWGRTDIIYAQGVICMSSARSQCGLACACLLKMQKLSITDCVLR